MTPRDGRSVAELLDDADYREAALYDAVERLRDIDPQMSASVPFSRGQKIGGIGAVIAGLIERRFPGQEKTGRQVTFSTYLIYNVLREHEADHVLMKAAWNDAASGLLDIRRLGKALVHIRALKHEDACAYPVDELLLAREIAHRRCDAAGLEAARAGFARLGFARLARETQEEYLDGLARLGSDRLRAGGGEAKQHPAHHHHAHAATYLLPPPKGGE